MNVGQENQKKSILKNSLASSMDSLTMQNILKPLSLSFLLVAKSYEECSW